MTLLSEFREQLLEAATDRARSPRVSGRSGATRREWRRARTPIAAATSVLVVIAVVAVALLTLGHAGADRSSTPGGQRGRAIGSGHGGGVAATRTQLLSELGVLRRGHAPARPSGYYQHSLSLTGPRDSGTPPVVDRSLVRIVRTGGYTVALLPATDGHTTGLAMTVHWPKGTGLWNAEFEIDDPVSPTAIARRGINDVEYVTGAVNRAVFVVPDGVARVQLSRFQLAHADGRSRVTIAAASGLVHDNVALITLRGVTPAAFDRTSRTLPHKGGIFRQRHCRVVSLLDFVPASAQLTWWSAGGNRIRTTRIRVTLDAYSTQAPPNFLPSCHPAGRHH